MTTAKARRAFVAVVAAVALAPAAAAPLYEVIDLRTVPAREWEWGCAYSLNNLVEVVGWTRESDD